MTTKACIYVRISSDPTGQALGVERQEEDCRKLAKAKGLTVVEVYSDNDLSASTKAKKPRPEYERMVSDAKAGKFSVVLCYSNSRLTRRLMDLETWVSLAEQHKVKVHTVVSGDDDLSTADGRMVARIKASVDAAEAERIGERVKRAKQQKAMSGQPLKARYRTFGYTDDFKPVPEEAAVVKEAFNRMARGDSAYSIHEWIKDEFPVNPVTGSEFKYNTVLSMLSNARYAGFNVYKGDVIGRGNQEPIITEAVWEAANSNRYVRNRRHAYGVKSGSNSRKYLLVGFLRCGECMSAMANHKVANRDPSYRCTKGKGGCGKVGMKMQWVDEAVSLAMVEHMGSSTTAPVAVDTTDYDTEIAAIEGQVKELRQAFKDRALPMSDFLELRNDLETKVKELRAQQGQQEAKHKASVLITNAFDFRSFDLSQKRAMLADQIDGVVIHAPIDKNNRRVDLHRIEIHWKDGEIENLGETADMESERLD